MMMNDYWFSNMLTSKRQRSTTKWGKTMFARSGLCILAPKWSNTVKIFSAFYYLSNYLSLFSPKPCPELTPHHQFDCKKQFLWSWVRDKETEMQSSERPDLLRIHCVRWSNSVFNLALIRIVLWFVYCLFNSCWRDTIWQNVSESTSLWVMACCLTTPNLCLIHNWLSIKNVLWHTLESHFARCVHELDP